MTSETELTGLAPSDLRRELQRQEKQRDRLVKEFPHLAQLPETPSVISQYAEGKGRPERVLLYDLTRRIRSLKVELIRRDADLDQPSGERPERDTDPLRAKKNRGRPPENEKIYRRICEEYQKHKMQMKPKQLAELPALKPTLNTFTNPANAVSKALMWGRKHGLL